MRLVRRPTNAADGQVRLLELAAALDAEGTAKGELFEVCKHEAEAGPENALGPFVKDSDTSRQAALDNYPRAGSQRHRVLERLRDCPWGATRDELAAALELPDSTVDPRVWELVRGGWVRETTAKRVTRSGSEAHVLELTEKGLFYREGANA